MFNSTTINVEEKFEEISKKFWSTFDKAMNELDPKRTLIKKDGQYIYCIAVPGFGKEEIKVKNHKESKGLIITGSKTDSITGADRTLEHSYTYPKGLSVKGVKCLNGLLYITFEDTIKSSTAEDVKVED
jgi:HSP20 family molecular chaperone IbpA